MIRLLRFIKQRACSHPSRQTISWDEGESGFRFSITECIDCGKYVSKFPEKNTSRDLELLRSRVNEWLKRNEIGRR